MSDFKAKMHQIQSPLPQTPAGFKGPTSKGRKEMGKGERGRRKEGEREGERKEREGEFASS